MTVATLGWEHVDGLKDLDDANVGIPSLLMHSANRLLPRLVATWPMVAKRLTNPGLQEPLPDGLPSTEYTRYLWACIEPNPVDIWAQSSGLPVARHVEEAMMMLLDNAIIFPDGSMSKWATRFLKTEGDRFGIKPEDQQT